MEEIPTSVIGVITFVAGLIVQRLLSAYAAKKGENLATREDVAGITRQIESVKLNHERVAERIRSSLQIDVARHQAFQQGALDALRSIDSLLVELTLHCWKRIAERGPNEHYVWSHVDEATTPERGLHYYRVAIDKVALESRLYLNDAARTALKTLADQVGLAATVEQVREEDMDEELVRSIPSAYETCLNATDACRDALKIEFELEERPSDPAG